MTRFILWMQARPLWTLFGILVYLALLFPKIGVAATAFEWLTALPGQGTFLRLVAVFGAAVLLAALWSILRRPPRHMALLLFYWVSTLVLIPAAYFLLFAVNSKLLLMLQYAVLAVALFALTGRVLDTLLWVVLASATIEGIQYWILLSDWGVYFDFNDVIIALLGGAVGILLLLSSVDPGRLILPGPSRPVWRSAPMYLLTTVVLAAPLISRFRPFAGNPGSGEEPWFTLSRTLMPEGFWHQEAWGKVFHVLGPMEALVGIALLIGFYSLIDYLAQAPPRPGSGYLDRLHSLLVRVTRSTPYMAPLDGMRFVAIAAVVLFHLEFLIPREAHGGEWIRGLLGYGNIGVQLFFAISGFILAVPMLEDRLFGAGRVSLGRYYLRRLTRIEPPYLICLGLLVLFGLTTHPGPNDDQHLLASAFYVHGLVYDTFSTINFVAWSLEVEIQFYLLMPFIAWLFFRGDRPWLRRILLAASCLPFMVRQSMTHDHFPHGLFFVDQVQFFVAGIIVADIYVSGRRTRGDLNTGNLRYDLLSTLGFILVPCVMHWHWESARYIVPLGIIIWMHGVLRGVIWRRILGNRWLAVTGGMCYTMYLYHWLILSGTLKVIGGFPFESTWANLLLVGPVLLALVVIISALLYLAFEKPFMRGLQTRKHRDSFGLAKPRR